MKQTTIIFTDQVLCNIISSTSGKMEIIKFTFLINIISMRLGTINQKDLSFFCNFVLSIMFKMKLSFGYINKKRIRIPLTFSSISKMTIKMPAVYNSVVVF